MHAPSIEGETPAARGAPAAGVAPDRIRFAIYEPLVEERILNDDGTQETVSRLAEWRLGFPRTVDDKLVAIIEAPSTCIPYLSEGRHVRLTVQTADRTPESKFLTVPEVLQCARKGDYGFLICNTEA
jgi:hypothetical protein